MPVMIILRASKVTPEQYEAVRDAVRWHVDPPAGAISHAISFTDAGAVEVNVWESEASFNRYVQARLQPVLDDLGIVVDEVQVLETYNVAVGAPALPHMLPVAGRPEPAPQGPVIALFRNSNIPTAVYDDFRSRAPLDEVPLGALSHAYGRVGDDILAVDVWEDAGEMMTFLDEVIIPAVEGAGIAFRWPEIVPLQSFVATPAAKRHERPFVRSAPALAPAE